MKKFKLVFRITRIIFYITLFLSFALIPCKVIESKSICFTYNTTGLLCPTCGVTRSFSHLMHFDLVNAYKFNPIFITIIFPICFIIIIQDTFIIIKDLIKKTNKDSLLEYLVKI